jgi:hypothetical protein
MSAAAVAAARRAPHAHDPSLAAPSAARALLSLLDEPREALKVHALERLHAVVDNEWAEVASAIATIEALYEDEEFSSRCEAALLASKVRAKTTRGARVICGLDQIPSFG